MRTLCLDCQVDISYSALFLVFSTSNIKLFDVSKNKSTLFSLSILCKTYIQKPKYYSERIPSIKITCQKIVSDSMHILYFSQRWSYLQCPEYLKNVSFYKIN